MKIYWGQLAPGSSLRPQLNCFNQLPAPAPPMVLATGASLLAEKWPPEGGRWPGIREFLVPFGGPSSLGNSDLRHRVILKTALRFVAVFSPKGGVLHQSWVMMFKIRQELPGLGLRGLDHSGPRTNRE